MFNVTSRGRSAGHTCVYMPQRKFSDKGSATLIHRGDDWYMHMRVGLAAHVCVSRAVPSKAAQRSIRPYLLSELPRFGGY